MPRSGSARISSTRRSRRVRLHVVAEAVRGGVVGHRHVLVAELAARRPPSPPRSRGRPRAWCACAGRRGCRPARSGRGAGPRARPRARRGSRAAPAGCTASRAARRPPPRWRTACESPLSSSATPYSLTCRPRRTASVRSASLCLPGAREVLEQVAEGLLRHDPQVHRQARVRDRLGTGLARGRDGVDRVQPGERLHERGRGRSRRRRCRGPSPCRRAAARCPPAPRAARTGGRAAWPRAPRPR